MLNVFGKEPRLLNLSQGTPEWHEARKGMFTASNAGAMMGVSPFKTRAELLRELATGETQEVTSFQQTMFDNGHRVEKKKRAEYEVNVGIEMYPVTLKHGNYLASMDGLNMFDGADIGWEHKYCARSDKNYDLALDGTIPEHYRWQLDHQIMVSGVERIEFWVTNQAETHTAQVMYEKDEERIKQLIGGWEEFAIELENYEASEQITPDNMQPAPANPILPALTVEIIGDTEVKTDTVNLYYKEAINWMNAVNRDLETDQDFVDATEVVKFCKENELRLDNAKDSILLSLPDIGYLFDTIDSANEEFRNLRLELNKKVNAKKNEVKDSLVMDAVGKIGDEHLSRLKACIKNKRTTKSVQEALDSEMAKIKSEPVEMNEYAKGFVMGMKYFKASMYGAKKKPISIKRLAEYTGLSEHAVKRMIRDVV